ncbi:hypothetical protein FVE85_4772 [Porphyridium purpureum]|uniref:Glycosyltransferase 61 catalytic domain-containing protein n=1 Tax=Porphyridium purpureum TaxID=35688 RepID=A0A5J4YQW0_PORPP|nr:hypothetical protein FVE85_4772 [Porphyridium purpureum]|eukprot:POR1399..scf236_6
MDGRVDGRSMAVFMVWPLVLAAAWFASVSVEASRINGTACCPGYNESRADRAGVALGFTTRLFALDERATTQMYLWNQPASLEHELSLRGFDVLPTNPAEVSSWKSARRRKDLPPGMDVRSMECRWKSGPAPPSSTSGEPLVLPVLVLRNVFVNSDGQVYRPESSSPAWFAETGGGCCFPSWQRALRIARRGPGTLSPGVSTKKYVVVKRAISFVHHHGSTFYHFIGQVVPRVMMVADRFAPGGDPELKALFAVSGDDPSIWPATQWLEPLGIPDHAKVLLPTNHSENNLQFPRGYVFVEELMVPPGPEAPSDRFPGTCPRPGKSDVVNALRKGVKCELKGESSSRKKIVLMVRRMVNVSHPECYTKRCMGNIAEVYDTLLAHFGNEHNVTLFPPVPTVRQTICTFSDADVVIGIHGAGFTNMMFMRSGSLAIHIGAPGAEMWYSGTAARNKVKYIGLTNPQVSYGNSNITVNASRIVMHVSQYLAERIKS